MREERPILFSSPMICAIIEGRKTQTRRIVKPCPTNPANTPWWKNGWLEPNRCPYGFIGDRLWVRETFTIETNFDLDPCEPPFKDGRPINWHEDDDYGRWWEQCHYAATDPVPELFNEDCTFEKCANDGYCQHWKPAIFMPRWASRITLEVTDVRVQRVQEIGEEDSRAEGCDGVVGGPDYNRGPLTARAAFMNLWDSINCKRGYGWDKNPWVWVIQFKRV